MWVRSEYAGELAVLATWLTALLPWSVSYISRPIEEMGGRFTVINVRFAFVQFHYLYGVSFGEQSWREIFQLVHRMPSFVPTNQELEAWIWVGAAALYAILFGLSVLYYAREDWLHDRLPIHPVRLFGAGFVVLAVAFSVATAMFYQHQVTVPIGALFMWVFAAILLRVELT